MNYLPLRDLKEPPFALAVVSVPDLVKHLAKVKKDKRPGFEGGQKPLYLRLPKRGFYNRFGMNYVEINVGSLNCFEDGTVVEPVMLIEHGMIKNIRDGVRILGNGELTKKLTVQAMGFSKSAEEKIIAAGGKVEVI